MPLYEYHCSKCGKNFDVIQKFADAPVAIHEECGGVVERVLSAPSFQFKGSGWYVNDYGKGGKKPSSGDDAGEKKSGDSDKKSGDSEKQSGESDRKSDTEKKSRDSKPAETKTESKADSKSDSKSESTSESKSKSKNDSKPAAESKSPAKSD